MIFRNILSYHMAGQHSASWICKSICLDNIIWSCQNEYLCQRIANLWSADLMHIGPNGAVRNVSIIAFLWTNAFIHVKSYRFPWYHYSVVLPVVNYWKSCMVPLKYSPGLLCFVLVWSYHEFLVHLQDLFTHIIKGCSTSLHNCLRTSEVRQWSSIEWYG